MIIPCACEVSGRTIFFFKQFFGQLRFLVFGALVEEALCGEAGDRLCPSVERGHSQSVPFLRGKKRDGQGLIRVSPRG